MLCVTWTYQEVCWEKREKHMLTRPMKTVKSVGGNMAVIHTLVLGVFNHNFVFRMSIAEESYLCLLGTM